MPQPGHKACPYCQEEILVTAVKCRYCQEWLIAPSKEAPEEVIGNLVGREIGSYKVVSSLGDGGMGSIWKAEHTSLGRIAAIKVLHSHLVSYKDVVRRFLAEARTVVGLGSPYLVEILDLGALPDGRPYFIMEYLDGTPLDQWMETRKPTIAEVFAIAEQLLMALSVVHEKNIVHRDLKPSNVMIVKSDGDVRVKLLDFGIAKFLHQEGTPELDIARTMTGMTVGTPVYMSPEQAGGVRDIDARSDIYAAGVLLYHVATGRPPFLSENLLHIMEMHRGAPVPPPRSIREDIPKPLEAWLLQCLIKHRERRFSSTQIALDALLRAKKQVRLSDVTPQSAEALTAKKLIHTKPLLALGATLGVSALLWLAWPGSPEAEVVALAPEVALSDEAQVSSLLPTPGPASTPTETKEEIPSGPPLLDTPEKLANNSFAEPPKADTVEKAPKKSSAKRPSTKTKTTPQKTTGGPPGPEGLLAPYKKNNK
jgi:serine/threonine protein kinase